MVFAFGGAICDDDSSSKKSYPNCKTACEIIEDCGILDELDDIISDCVVKCVYENDYKDLSDDDLTIFENSTCDQILNLITSKSVI